MTVLAFTRPVRRLDDAVRLAESKGFEVLAAPSLDIEAGRREDFDSVRAKIAAGRYDTAVISSVTATEECLGAWGGETAALLGRMDVVPIGRKTADHLAGIGVEPYCIPSEYSSDGAAAALLRKPCVRSVLLIHSDHGSDVIERTMRDAGASVEELVAYRLRPCGDDSRMNRILEEGKAGRIDVYVFTSPMSVTSFVYRTGVPPWKFFRGCKIAAIGGPTAKALADCGLQADIMPEEATFEALLSAIESFFRKE
jgi:uroporphyrinogen-III synthase